MADPTDDCVRCEPGMKCAGFCKAATAQAVIAAAESLNQANVSAAASSGARLYREAMTPEARALDEAFQAYYEARQAPTSGPKPLPLMYESVEIDAKKVGFTLEMSDQTRREIEEINRNSALAALNAGNILFD